MVVVVGLMVRWMLVPHCTPLIALILGVGAVNENVDFSVLNVLEVETVSIGVFAPRPRFLRFVEGTTIPRY